MIEKIVINTLYKQDKERKLSSLSQLYNDHNRLKDTIRSQLSELGINPEIYKSNRVLIKPNWVRNVLKPNDDLCLTTHPRFILAVLDIVLDNKPSEVIIADAPIQGCKWDKLLPNYFYDEVRQRANDHAIPIRIIDWRRRVVSSKDNEVRENIRSIDNYVLFDMGTQSYLEPITTDKPLFRVTNYDPDQLAESHKQGKHLYCIAKEVFDADYIIALPKAKTHQKTGITNALKLLVGINGDKDFLPHHRVGGEKFGGDCYPGGNLILRLSEHVLDMANRRMGKKTYKPLLILVKFLWRSVPKTPKHSLAAAWHGNDTTWRMVMDINVIAKYGRSDGTIADDPQRDILYISDGIIGGQGDGPLKPDPLPLGVIMASTNPATMDYALAKLMQFDPLRLPLISNSLELFGEAKELVINGERHKFEDLDNIAIATIAPPGWVEYLQDLDNHRE